MDAEEGLNFTSGQSGVQGSDIESSFSAAKEQKWLEEVVSVAAKYSMKSIIYSRIIIVILVILDYEYLSADD